MIKIKGLFDFSAAAFVLFFILMALLPGSYITPSLFNEPKQEKALTTDSTTSFNVIFGGDAMVHETQFKSAYNESGGFYDFHPVFEYIQPVLAHGQLNVINLETTLAGPPYAGYPSFSSPDTFAYALKKAGFNYVALANNHALDKGKNGLLRTLDVLEELNIPSMGTYRDSYDRANRYPLTGEINQIRFALLNYSYGTNGIPVPSPLIVNLLDTAIIRKDIQNAKMAGADVVMVYYHWGDEYARLPNRSQKELARFTFKAGADIIIGSHPHVVQPIELIDIEIDDVMQQRWVAWSLGNFVSNQRWEHVDGGILVKFTVEKNIYTGKVDIRNMKYLPYWVYRPLNPTRYYVVPLALLENNDSLFPDMAQEYIDAFQFFAKETRKHLYNEEIPLKEWKLR